eukprot:9483635-Pyramimonas_sp.AAC.1
MNKQQQQKRNTTTIAITEKLALHDHHDQQPAARHQRNCLSGGPGPPHQGICAGGACRGPAD